MLSHAQIKFIRSLQQKKFRKLHSRFVAEGGKIVSEMLQGPFNIKQIYALESWLDIYSQRIPATIQTFTVSTEILSRISGLSSANQVVAVAEIPDRSSTMQDDVASKGFNLYLDGIQDPGNFGTIIRTADWFGIDCIYCSPETADVFNPKVIQASMGSFCRVKITYGDLRAILDRHTEKPTVYGAALDGKNLFETAVTTPAIVVIGNESKGISDSLSQLIQTHLRIPGASDGASPASPGAESLNASVAAAIIMAWFNKTATPNRTKQAGNR